MRYELTNHEWAAIGSMLLNKPRGVPQVNDRRVLSGIFGVFAGKFWSVHHLLQSCPSSEILRH